MITQKLKKPIAFVTLAIMLGAQVALAAPAGGQKGQQADPQVVRETVKLIEPIGGKEEITIGSGFKTWLDYFEVAGVWLYTIAVGICVLWFLIGGIGIMVSGNDSGLRQSSIEKMKWSLIALLILTFSGTILRTLNNLFFT